ncbi:MAG: hypothetical protein KJO11_02925 [Gemmatimonadetes bacterium]|nr:hypothetical protein [Gemmatimonadota bacterium]MBT8402264.1 hypothetical protein [Gemmatimonadota bacterium]NNK62469.1 hypothetical protein [Gemmatimonadota bacterium]
MGKGRSKKKIEKARDDLMSHIVRCDVLEAAMEHRLEWLDDTMDYMADRWPGLNDLQLAQLEMMGRQYLRPVIEHGAAHTALNRSAAPRLTDDGVVVEAQAQAA